VTVAYIDGVSEGAQYNVQIRAVNAAGVPSDWTTIGPITASGGSMTVGFSFADAEIPVGAMTGTNPLYTLAHAPNPPASLSLYFDGILQRQGALTDGADYALAGNTITYWRTINLPDGEGDSLVAWYRY
jgi:hypothetical protein